MNPRRLRILGGRSTVSEAELVSAISSATGLTARDAQQLERLLRSTPAEMDAPASSAEMAEKLAAVLRRHGFEVSVESMASARNQLILWLVAAVVFAAAFWLPPRFFAIVVPLLPIAGLFLLLSLPRVLLRFDPTSAVNRMPGVVMLRIFLERRLVNAPIWMRRVIGTCCIAATIALVVYQIKPRTSDPAPQADGREQSSPSRPSAAPVDGRER